MDLLQIYQLSELLFWADRTGPTPNPYIPHPLPSLCYWNLKLATTLSLSLFQHSPLLSSLDQQDILNPPQPLVATPVQPSLAQSSPQPNKESQSPRARHEPEHQTDWKVVEWYQTSLDNITSPPSPPPPPSPTENKLDLQGWAIFNWII